MALEQNLAYWNATGPSKKFNNPNLILDNPGLIGYHDSILDIGCGYGRTLVELIDAGYDNLFGIDYAPEMIRAAKSNLLLQKVKLAICSATNLPFSDNSFSSVLLFAVLNCLPETKLEVETLKEAKRVVKKGGYIFVNDFIASETLLSGSMARSDNYGSFVLLTVDGQCTMRHTSVNRVNAMTFGMPVIDWKLKTEISMNGNPLNLLSYILQKN